MYSISGLMEHIFINPRKSITLRTEACIVFFLVIYRWNKCIAWKQDRVVIQRKCLMLTQFTLSLQHAVSCNGFHYLDKGGGRYAISAQMTQQRQESPHLNYEHVLGSTYRPQQKYSQQFFVSVQQHGLQALLTLVFQVGGACSQKHLYNDIYNRIFRSGRDSTGSTVEGSFSDNKQNTRNTVNIYMYTDIYTVLYTVYSPLYSIQSCID